MKPVFAVRETTCHECKEPIAVGERRLDDGIKKGKFFTRVHYHPACAWIRWTRWWENNEGKPSPMIRNGKRPHYDLTPEQRTVRTAALDALRGACNYWIPKLNVLGDPSTLSHEEYRSLVNFVLLYRKHTAVLEAVGGVPERYANLNLPEVNLVKEVSTEQVSVNTETVLGNN